MSDVHVQIIFYLFQFFNLACSTLNGKNPSPALCNDSLIIILTLTECWGTSKQARQTYRFTIIVANKIMVLISISAKMTKLIWLQS